MNKIQKKKNSYAVVTVSRIFGAIVNWMVTLDEGVLE